MITRCRDRRWNVWEFFARVLVGFVVLGWAASCRTAEGPASVTLAVSLQRPGDEVPVSIYAADAPTSPARGFRAGEATVFPARFWAAVGSIDLAALEGPFVDPWSAKYRWRVELTRNGKAVVSGGGNHFADDPAKLRTWNALAEAIADASSPTVDLSIDPAAFRRANEAIVPPWQEPRALR